jgi:hypothetical protein
LNSERGSAIAAVSECLDQVPGLHHRKIRLAMLLESIVSLQYAQRFIADIIAPFQIAVDLPF